MGRRRRNAVNQIVCSGGVTVVESMGVSAIYKYKWWWFRVNPRVLFPSLRRDHRKIIIVNGKRRGWGEIRSGLIPLSMYNIKGKGLRFSVARFIRKYLGLQLRTHEKGYVYIGIGPYRYIVIHHVTSAGFYSCEVYDKHTEDQIGNFIFNADFTEVVLRTSRDGVMHTLQVIIGYVADSLVYSRAVKALSSSIKIIV